MPTIAVTGATGSSAGSSSPPCSPGASPRRTSSPPCARPRRLPTSPLWACRSATPTTRSPEPSPPRCVVDAAAQAGVELLAYTSILNAGTTTMLLAADHQATEQLIAESGLPHAFLRNGWYTENSLMELEAALEHGIFGAAGQGHFSPAARADYADAAAAVLTDHAPPTGAAYELGGDEPLTMHEVATRLGDATGRPIAYHDLPVEQYAGVLAQAGLPEPVAQVLADASAAIARGELTTGSGDLRRLIGRPSTPVKTTFEEALVVTEITA